MLQLSRPRSYISQSSFVCLACRSNSSLTGRPWRAVYNTPRDRPYATDTTKPLLLISKPAKDEPRRSRKPQRLKAKASKANSTKLKLWRETLGVLKSLQAAQQAARRPKPEGLGEPEVGGEPDEKLAAKNTSENAPESKSDDSQSQVKLLAGALDLLRSVLNESPPHGQAIDAKTDERRNRKSYNKESRATDKLGTRKPRDSSGTKTQARPTRVPKKPATAGEPQTARHPSPSTPEPGKPAAIPRPQAGNRAEPRLAPTTTKEVSVLSPIKSRYRVEKIYAKAQVLVPIEKSQPPVPRIQYGLDRALFNPGVYHLQDPRSRVYNFDPYLATIMPLKEFDFNALKQYVTSSKDNTLISIAAEHKKKYAGSTSSMTATLSHFHYLLSSWRPVNPAHTSQAFVPDSFNFTRIMRTPAAAFLHWKDGTYAIDADKEFDTANILSMLGKSMEKLLTLPKEDFEKYRITKSHELSEAERNEPESYHYTTLGNLMMRSQLDAHDKRLPGTGMFDLKTRAVVSIRMDARDFHRGLGYEIRGRIGQWESYEREYFDMIRSAFLKYSLQVRMGRMDGIFVAFHNTQRIFGFQYVSINEMDLALHGTEDRSLGDMEFKLSLRLLNDVLDKATARFPGQSLRLHFETRPSDSAPFMYIFAKPVTAQEMSEVQDANKASIEKFERDILGLVAEAEAEEEMDDLEPVAEGEEAQEDHEIEEEDEWQDAQSESVWESMQRKVEEAMENEALGEASIRDNIEDALEQSGLLRARSPEESRHYVNALLEAITSSDTETAAKSIQSRSLEDGSQVTTETSDARATVTDGDGLVDDEQDAELGGRSHLNTLDEGGPLPASSREMSSSGGADGIEAAHASESSEHVEDDVGRLQGEFEGEGLAPAVGTNFEEVNLQRLPEEGSDETEGAFVDEQQSTGSTLTPEQIPLKDLIIRLAGQIQSTHSGETNAEAEQADLEASETASSPRNKRFEKILSQMMASTREIVSASDEDMQTLEPQLDNASAIESAEPSSAGYSQPDPRPGGETASRQDGETAPGQDEDEVFGMILTVRNKVNGKYVKRPELLTKDSRWLVEYAIEDILPTRTGRLYAAIMERRRKQLTDKGKDKAWNEHYTRKLHRLSEKGRTFRKKENGKSRDRAVHVYGVDEELDWTKVFCDADVEGSASDSGHAGKK